MSKSTKTLTTVTITLILNLLALWGLNEATGIFTYMHLDNERQIAQNVKDPNMLDGVVAELVADTQSPFMWKRRVAAIELEKLGKKAENALPALDRLAHDKDYEVRAVAKEAIANIHNQG